MAWVPAAVFTPTDSLLGLVADFPAVWADSSFQDAKASHGFRLTYEVSTGVSEAGVLASFGWRAYGDFLELVFGEGDHPEQVLQREFRADDDFTVQLTLWERGGISP